MPAAPEITDALLRALGMLAACGAAGLALFRDSRIFAQPLLLRARATAWIIAALLLGVLHVLAQPARFTGDFADTLSTQWLGLALDSSFGVGAGLRLAGLVLSAASLAMRSQGSWLALAGLLLLAAGHAQNGHASSDTFGGLAPMVAYGLHVALFALWWGSLLGLQALGRHQDAQRFGAALARFSTAATGWFPLLPLSGLWLAWQLLGGWPGGLSLYTGLLAAKVALVLAAATLAALNRWRWTPQLVRGALDAQRVLRRSIAIEMALVTVIVLVTIAMTTWSAPAAQAAAPIP